MSLVEYFDPDGIFPLLVPQLNARLPLRNLHWKSSNRPLRSIGSLQVNFVRGDRRPDDAESARDIPSDGPAPVQVDQSSENGNARVEKGRRHQIPGLRHTPYLKIYLLRCDDVESYRSTSRKLLREWIKTHTSDNTNHHDAFEWLIIHVVFPGTAAASQSGSKRVSGGDVDGPRERTVSGSRWPGRSSNTILEKIQADFNQTGKSTPDRVTQLLLQREAQTMHTAPAQVQPTDSPQEESADEREAAWNELMSKFKSLILNSFGLRVGQYEEDIKDKDLQRTLPGWNFCTFFILKEGLAIAFESVGLYVDALMLYDELAVGLETTIRDHSQDEDEDESNKFLAFTQSLVDQYHEAQRSSRPRSSILRSSNPLDISRKDYRGLIMSNKISVFDIRCYLFSRQFLLLNKITNIGILPQSSQDNHSASFDGILGTENKSNIEDLLALGDLCHRALSFTTSIARTMRVDLWTGLDSLEISGGNTEKTVDNMVSSWTYSVISQILQDSTSISLMRLSPKTEARMNKNSDHVMNSIRKSSLTLSIPSSLDTPTPAQFEQDISLPDAQSVKPTKYNGLANVAAYRAELFLVQRRLLAKIGNSCGWQIRSRLDKKEIEYRRQQAASSDDNDEESLPPGSGREHAVADPSLIDALASFENFRRYYESLSNKAAWHYRVAGRVNSVERLTADLVIMKFEEGDYAAAAGHFGHIAKSENKWNFMETSLLTTYALCLKELHRNDEYIRVVLSLLTLMAKANQEKRSKKGSTSTSKTTSSDRDQSKFSDIDTQKMLNNAVSLSCDLPYEVSTPLGKYFDTADVDSHIHVSSACDGFKIDLTVRKLFPGKIPIDSASVNLVNDANGQTREIWARSESKFTIEDTAVRVALDSNATTFGLFAINKIVLQSGKIKFIHDCTPKTDVTIPDPGSITDPSNLLLGLQQSAVFCYSRLDSLYAKLSAAGSIHIGKTRSLALTLHSGSNEIMNGKIILRSASAGLRLLTGEAISEDESLMLKDVTTTGVLTFDALTSNTNGKITIPYDVERNIAEVALKLEVHYTTATGSFEYLMSTNVKIETPLDVTVQDIFKEKSLFSKVVLKPVAEIPIHLLDVRLSNSDNFKVRPIVDKFSPLLAFSKEPACATFEICPRIQEDESKSQAVHKTLNLTVTYRSMEEDALEQIAANFSENLAKSEFQSYRHLLVSTLEHELRKRINFEDYDYAGLVGEMPLLPFEDLQWSNALECLPEDVRGNMNAWLQAWHENNSSIQLLFPEDEDYAQKFPARTLEIDFEVPQLQFLCTTSLRLVDLQPTSPDFTPTVVIGEALNAELKIRYTKIWDLAPSTQKKTTLNEFSFDVLADTSMWLVGGQRRARYTAQKDETLTFNLILVPLRTGHALLPTVEASLVKQHDKHDEKTSCITDCESQSTVVAVIENMQSTTVGLGSDGLVSRGVTLLSSEENSSARLAVCK